MSDYLDQITVGSTTYDIKDSDAQRKTIEGSGAPSSGTVGAVGIHYFNIAASAAPYEYVCTAVSNGNYTWMPAGYGEDGSSGVYYGSTQPSDPNIKVWVDPTGDVNDAVIPSGGNVGQALIKASSSNYDIIWGDVEALPTGGNQGQALLKNSASDYDIIWGDVEALPTSGNQGQLLAKKTNANYDVEWVNPTLPVTLTTLTLPSTWTAHATLSNVYTQQVTINNGTIHTKVDIEPNSAVLIQMLNDGVFDLFIENLNASFVAYAIGAAPTTSLTIQASLVETT